MRADTARKGGTFGRLVTIRAACVVLALLNGHGAFAQATHKPPVWAEFIAAAPIGSGNTATTQTLNAVVPGSGRGSGAASLTFSVSGGVAAWNGNGVGANDDGYYAAPNLPLPGITFVNGAPGYNGGVPALAAASFATAYNTLAAPASTPHPVDRSAVYFDAGDGSTVTISWDFTALHGGRLLAGSWIFVDGVDQGERVVLNGPSGWIGSIHTADSTTPRPPQPGVPPTVGSPAFPNCSPALTLSPTTLQLDGRYGDLSNVVPACANLPVPVPGVTVGYTKGMDSVGVWIQTASDLTTLTLTANDQDTTPRGPQGNYLGPDNNFVLGVGFIAAVEPLAVPGVGVLALALLALAVSGCAALALRRTRRQASRRRHVA